MPYINYLAARLREPSSWAAIAALIVAFVPAGTETATVVTGIAGALGVLLSEQHK